MKGPLVIPDPLLMAPHPCEKGEEGRADGVARLHYFFKRLGQLLIKVRGALLSSGALVIRNRPSRVTS